MPNNSNPSCIRDDKLQILVHADVAMHDKDKCPKCGKKLNLSANEPLVAKK